MAWVLFRRTARQARGTGGIVELRATEEKGAGAGDQKGGGEGEGTWVLVRSSDESVEGSDACLTALWRCAELSERADSVTLSVVRLAAAGPRAETLWSA